MVVNDGADRGVKLCHYYQAGGCPTEYSAGSGEYNKGSSSIVYILLTMIFWSNKCIQDLKMAKGK